MQMSMAVHAKGTVDAGSPRTTWARGLAGQPSDRRSERRPGPAAAGGIPRSRLGRGEAAPDSVSDWAAYPGAEFVVDWALGVTRDAGV